MTSAGRSRVPEWTLTCCRCRKRMPVRSDVYVLDNEWGRRYPDMTGRIACQPCALASWTCQDGTGRYVPGHIRAAGRSEFQDFDSWCHIVAHGTRVGIVREFPEYAAQQGGEPYLRWLRERKAAVERPR